MGLIVSEVYDALIEAGASPDTAKAAAGAVPPAENMATKEDIARLEGNMATKEDVARLAMATKEDFAKLEMATKQDITRLEANMATREDVARLAMATKEDITRLDNHIARLEANMATKEDIAKIEKRLAVLSFAVFSFFPAVLAFMVKLTFFP